MPELIRGPDLLSKVHHSSCKGMFPACLRAGLHLVEWIVHIVGLSYLVAGHTVHSSGCRLQLASELVFLTTSVIKMIQARSNFLILTKLFIIDQVSGAKIKLKNTTNRVICGNWRLLQHSTDMSIRSSQRLLVNPLCTKVSHKHA